MRTHALVCVAAAVLAFYTTPCVAYGAYAAHSSPRRMESLKFYVPPCGKPGGWMEKQDLIRPCMAIKAKTVSEGGADCARGLHVWQKWKAWNSTSQERINLTSGSILEPVKDWLFVNDEYIAPLYIANLLRCRNLTLVDNVKDADLCYPSCKSWKIAKSHKCKESNWAGQWFRFEVRNSRMFRGCRDGIEGSPELIGRERRLKSGMGGNTFGLSYPPWLFDAKTGTCSKAKLPTNVSYTQRTYGNANRTEVLGLGSDSDFKCFVGVPYFTGIFAPSDSYAVAPWTLVSTKTNFLAFFGSLRLPFRGPFHYKFEMMAWMLQNNKTNDTAERHFNQLVYGSKAQRVQRPKTVRLNLAQLRNLSDQATYKSYYRSPLQDDHSEENVFLTAWTRRTLYKQIRTHANYEVSWTLFATSVFCWQPGGDTPTRRSFYDSWLFGCIPVIQDCAVKHYERIFGGHFFSHHRGANLADVVVVVSHKCHKWRNIWIRDGGCYRIPASLVPGVPTKNTSRIQYRGV